MNEQEVLQLIESMRTNLSVSDIIAMVTTLVGAVIALYSAFRAHLSKKQAEANADLAKQYAANADAANQAAKKYYEKWLEGFEAKSVENESIELKKKILLLCQNKRLPLSEIAENLNITSEKARELLEELRFLDNYKVSLCPEVKNLRKGSIGFGSGSFLKPNGSAILPKELCETHPSVKSLLDSGAIKKIGNEVYVSVERQNDSRQF